MKNRSILIVTFAGLFLGFKATASENTVTWVSPDTGVTWHAYQFSESASLLDMKKQCIEKGQALPDTEPAEMETDFFNFLSGPLGPDTENFPHFTFRRVEVRLFPYINRIRKEERYKATQAFDAELRDYFISVNDLCHATGAGNCQNSQDNIDVMNQKMAQQTEYYRQIGFLSMFVDALGHEANLEQLEQEYDNFRVQKDSYETARTVIISRDDPKRWSGLICVSK